VVVLTVIVVVVVVKVTKISSYLLLFLSFCLLLPSVCFFIYASTLYQMSVEMCLSTFA